MVEVLGKAFALWGGPPQVCIPGALSWESGTLSRSETDD